MRYHGKHLDALDCTAFSCHKEETEQSCTQDASFSTSATLGKDFLGERELCDILWVCICIWRSVRLIFIIWPYLIWCLALQVFYWNPRSSNNEWHIWWHDPIWSYHHPRGITSPYIDQSQYVYNIFIYPFPLPYRYIRLDFITFFVYMVYLSYMVIVFIIWM